MVYYVAVNTSFTMSNCIDKPIEVHAGDMDNYC